MASAGSGEEAASGFCPMGANADAFPTGQHLVLAALAEQEEQSGGGRGGGVGVALTGSSVCLGV